MKHQRKRKEPLQIRFMKKFFPFLERLAPRWAQKIYLKLFFRPLRHPFKPDEKKAMEAAQKWTITYRNKEIQLYKWGSGPKRALFIHGWSGRGSQGFAFAEQFVEKDYTFVSFDLPGHGLSSGQETNIFEVNEIVSDIVDSFGPFDCLIGHSFGGVVATYSLSQSLSFRKLIIIGSPHSNSFILDEFAETIGASKLFHEALEQYVQRRWNLRFEEVSIYKMMEDLNTNDVLVIHDREDKEVPYELTDYVVQQEPSPNLLTTQGLGHKRILKDEKVIEKVLAFSELGTREVELFLN